MYTIGFDTSHRFLLIVLMDEMHVVDSICMDCFKQQSEYIISKLDELLVRNRLTLADVDSVVCTVGPGSYTGVRIGLTVAKVLGSIALKNIYILSSLQLYAGLKKARVFIDARANRCYAGCYENGEAVEDDTVYDNETIKENYLHDGYELLGDLHLFGMQDCYDDLAGNCFALKSKWVKVDNVDILTPTYLKNREEYLKK